MVSRSHTIKYTLFALRHSESKLPSSDLVCVSQGAGNVIQQPPLRVAEWKGTQYVPPVSIRIRSPSYIVRKEKASLGLL